MQETAAAEAVEAVIRRRKTEKVLLDPDAAEPTPVEVLARNNPLVTKAIKAAGWAPFHFPRGVEGIAEPWRAHVVWEDAALAAAKHLRDDLGDTGKLPLLAAGCNALVIVTWLPEVATKTHADSIQPPPGPPRTADEQATRDEEHLAAAAAFVQNLLLMLTAHGMGTYWSSGGALRGPEMLDYFGIPAEERLLAAVFIEYPELADAERVRKPGGLRGRRTTDWLREVPE